ncbi:MAG: hypothetical protein Q7V88_04345 [Actinomycetota bacterium]|nr:hypothetical protein [Actinomycetota bacterium]
MRFRSATPLAAVGALTLLGLSACGGDSSGGSTAACGSITATVADVSEEDADVVVKATDGIIWNAKEYSAAGEEFTLYGVNTSQLPHNLQVRCADGSSAGLPIDLPSKGSSGAITITAQPGQYRIVCLIPGHSAMNSALNVI